VSLGLFIATNLLAATSQRRYVIKRSEGSVHLRATSKYIDPSLRSGRQR
jgi:hypothetical protein